MRVPRIYEPNDQITLNTSLSLSEDGANHVGRVLRMKEKEQIKIFNGNGHDYLCEITSSNKKEVIVKIIDDQKIDNESPLKIHLAQVISRGERMEFTLQKSVELGVSEFTPLISSRCGVRLKEDRLDKKHEQWQKIIISACEQCGRAIIPKLNPTLPLEDFLAQETSDLCLNLNPTANQSIKQLTLKHNNLRLLIGSEGGLSDEEIKLAQEHGYKDLLLGKRVLRTETASLVAISVLQAYFGDLA